MTILASRCKWALLVPVAVAACSHSDGAPDSDALRKADDLKHTPDATPPSAGTSDGWMSLAPKGGSSVNVGVGPGGGGGDGGMDASDGSIFDAGSDAPKDAQGALDAIFTTYLITSPSSTSRPSPSLFTPDPSAAVTRNGAFVIRTTRGYTPFSFQWTAAASNAIGYALQFGSDTLFYYSNPSMSSLPSGTVTMSAGLIMSTSVCSYVPNTCYQTTMNVYVVTQNADGGITGGLSPALVVPVAIDCGGCL